MLTVEKALKAEGLLTSTFVYGSFGTKTIDAYARWQRSPAGGRLRRQGQPEAPRRPARLHRHRLPRVETKLDGIVTRLSDVGKDVADHATRIRAGTIRRTR
ncbi:hypothetical protein [Streptomyces shenzhenensis]|uniref:hypothetical protein n=1 Tax=Streptomyces shenzhenensis TaxID=943815 RepID=UPI0011C42486|nr:hypothetical protein [Streptomyces shenzhenensis]